MSVISDKKVQSIELGNGKLRVLLIKVFRVVVLSDWVEIVCFCQGLQRPFQIFYQVLGGETFFFFFRSLFDLAKNDLTSKIINQTR